MSLFSYTAVGQRLAVCPANWYVWRTMTMPLVCWVGFAAVLPVIIVLTDLTDVEQVIHAGMMGEVEIVLDVD